MQMNGPSFAATVTATGTYPERTPTTDQIASRHTAAAHAHPAIPAQDGANVVPVQYAAASQTGTDVARKTADDAARQAREQFDAALQRLASRPETQILQARLAGQVRPVADPQSTPAANDSEAAKPAKPAPAPVLAETGDDMAADTNHDGKISDDERMRYVAPLTYRSSDRQAALTDSPSAFSLAEVNRAYGQVAAQAIAA
ncbi:hypothetical protein [Rugamonas apoptosis]|uniref:EF-hand domain-containing protein n=1 Tax=Rugamonas apoptosis TaxID=2758570 RepID=A0A7W2IM78_9BURK|nr:hypothetical protein [Rugamonas apoptosis]MBA5689222.1 hypothetical protein [Rugamonas apoptosis]